jgi:hypothetical protein
VSTGKKLEIGVQYRQMSSVQSNTFWYYWLVVTGVTVSCDPTRDKDKLSVIILFREALKTIYNSKTPRSDCFSSDV